METALTASLKAGHCIVALQHHPSVNQHRAEGPKNREGNCGMDWLPEKELTSVFGNSTAIQDSSAHECCSREPQVEKLTLSISHV